MNINYKISSANPNQIYSLLLNCDENFIPKLSNKTNIGEYANKIYNNAINFEAWNEDRLIGIISMYINQEKTLFGYITNVSILSEYANKGLASHLLAQCIEYSMDKNLFCIKLEVNESNIPALRLYEKFKFEIYEKNNSSKFMYLKLNQDLKNVQVEQVR